MPIEEMTTEEVARQAGADFRNGVFAETQSRQATAELTRRLIESNERLRKATESNNVATTKYNRTMFDLTLILVFLAALQIVTSIMPGDISWIWRIGLALTPVVIIYVGLRYK